MITIKDVACELQDILNGVSPNVPQGIVRPITATYEVQCAGYHLDHVFKDDKSGNFFPVFIDSGTGTINPIKGVGQVDYSFPVSIYAPVRFRDKMLALQEYLSECLVGAMLKLKVCDDRGEDVYEQGAITNMGAFEIGDITDMDLGQVGNPLKQFHDFVNANYRMPVDVMEPWISLTFALYVSTMNKANANGGFVYGNAIYAQLTYIDNPGEYQTLLTEKVKCDGIVMDFTASAQPQQGFDVSTGTAESEASNFPFTCARGFSFTALVRKNDFWLHFFDLYSRGKLNEESVEVEIYGDDDAFPYVDIDLPCIITNAHINAPLGAPMTVTLTFAKKGWVE